MLIASEEKGSAPLEAIFAIVLLMIVTLATVQLAFSLYGRNVLQASAHEAARAAIELGVADVHALSVAKRVVRRSAGGLFDHVRVEVSERELGGQRSAIIVKVGATLRPPGPLPLSSTTTAVATVVAESTPL